MPAAWFPLILSSLLPPFRPAPFLRRLATRLPLPTRRHPAAPRTGAPRGCPGPQTRQRRPLQNTRQPRNRGRSFSLARWERVGVRVFRATNLRSRKRLRRPTLHAALAPSHPSSTHPTAPTAPPNAPKPTLAVPRQKPASSPIALRETVETCPRRDPSVRFIRAPRLASPPSPQRTPKTSQKSAPNYLKSFLEETLIAREASASTPPIGSPAHGPLHPPVASPRTASPAPVRLFLPRPVGEGRGEGLPGNTPRFSTVASAHSPCPPGNRPAAPQEFFGKNSYARKAAPFRPANHPPIVRTKHSTPDPHDRR